MAIDDPNNYSLGSFFLALASIFVVGKVISSIFVKFRQPEVLGELTAGVILGSLALIPLLNEPGITSTYRDFISYNIVINLFLFENVYSLKRYLKMNGCATWKGQHQATASRLVF